MFTFRYLQVITNTLAQAAKRFPSLRTLNSRVTASAVPLNELQVELRNVRAEFWIRKFTTYGSVLKAAPGEFMQAMRKLANPGELRVGDFASAGVFGAFSIPFLFGCCQIRNVCFFLLGVYFFVPAVARRRHQVKSSTF